MKEDFLHYLWRYQKFVFSDLKTSTGEIITVINPGQYLQTEGPDFFNAQICIGDQKWAGNIEIHIKSSDWYLHRHETDANYDNVILHVVWENDTPVYRKDSAELPVLELKNYVNVETIQKYNALTRPKSWIFCENQIREVDSFVLSKWQERLFFERLERKANFISQLLEEKANDWEAVLFCLLAKNFGLNTNGDAFYKMAKSIPFSVIRKEALSSISLEALFFGQLNIIPNDAQDYYLKEMKSQYQYLKTKYKLESVSEPIQFFKLRPDNFPTIRLSQLASIYHLKRQLFSDIIEANTLQEMYFLFNVGVGYYWKTHYNFDKESNSKQKILSNSFIDLLMVNTVIPIQFAYAKTRGKDISENLISLLSSISPEKNAIVDKFESLGIVSQSAFETQSLLQLKNEYCNAKRCLYCAIGMELLKK